MLLQFMVENFRSFHSQVTLDMIPVKSRIHSHHVLVSEPKGRRVKCLPLAILYGANASGKSNLIRALAFAQKLILRGTRGESPTETRPFLLAPDAAEKPSRFEFVLKHDEVLYTYGFTVTQKMVNEEWLFAVYQKQEQRLFERVTENGKARLEFGDKLAPTQKEAQRLQFVAEGTRPNQLFLTEAIERNVDLLKPLMHWFRDHLIIIWPESQYQDLVMRAHTDEQFREFLDSFLGIADTGIQGIELREEKLDTNRYFSGLPEEAKKRLLDKLDRTPKQLTVVAGKVFFVLRQDQDKFAEILTLQTKHQSSDGQPVYFDPRDESDGTQRLMHIAPALLNLQSSEDVYVIDELDRSLHPALCRLYIEAFLDGVTRAGKKGQLILTTHETNLLDLDLLRRDEIWFVEKDKAGASRLTSLAEFKYKVRADLKVARGYLNGRFGAIPLVGDTRRLFQPGGQI